ncbi:hypothetical protein RUR49_05515 [Pseudoxanthobacter sp. M-2]|uniref:hypothetical protein n=1 Tax=Pseudoxanthobacter sp. M-2 TaxID=3078754 RepID=UPI0038FD2277
MTFARKIPFLVFLVALVLCFIFLFRLKMFGELGPVVCVVGLGILFVWGEVGAYPFQGRWQVRSQISFFAALVILSGFGNGSLNNPPPPAWYPTPDTEWIVVPWLVFGLAMVARGCRVFPRPVKSRTESSENSERPRT